MGSPLRPSSSDDAIGLLAVNGLPSIPILLVHGTIDGTVPIAQSRQIAAAMTMAGRHTVVLEEPGEDHVGILTDPATIASLLALLRQV